MLSSSSLQVSNIWVLEAERAMLLVPPTAFSAQDVILALSAWRRLRRAPPRQLLEAARERIDDVAPRGVAALAHALPPELLPLLLAKLRTFAPQLTAMELSLAMHALSFSGEKQTGEVMKALEQHLAPRREARSGPM